MRDRISIGLTGRTAPKAIAAVAARAESAGFRALWLNDVPHGDSLVGLAVAAAATSRLRLGTGVIPLDRRPASEILAATTAQGLPENRLTLGIGSGGPKQALRRVEEGLSELRAGTGAELVVGALGPKMRELGARRADGVLFNWVTPGVVAGMVRELRDTGGSSARAVLYTRTIVSPDARAALEQESAAYASYPSYAAHFERSGFEAIKATIDGSDPGVLREAVSSYLDSVDELVLRAITPVGDGEELLAFVDAVADTL